MKKITIKFKDGNYKVKQGDLEWRCESAVTLTQIIGQILASTVIVPDPKPVESSVYGFTNNMVFKTSDIIPTGATEWVYGTMTPVVKDLPPDIKQPPIVDVNVAYVMGDTLHTGYAIYRLKDLGIQTRTDWLNLPSHIRYERLRSAPKVRCFECDATINGSAVQVTRELMVCEKCNNEVVEDFNAMEELDELPD